MNVLDERRQEYEDWINSPEFKVLADKVKARDGHRCVLCGSDKNLQCHHREYPEVFGTETLDMLTTLCGFHHENFHHPKSLEEIKNHTFELALNGGTKCPICDRRWECYPRKFTTGMAKAFAAIGGMFNGHPLFLKHHDMLRKTADGKMWVHVNRLLQVSYPTDTGSRGDFTKLRFFNDVKGDIIAYRLHEGLIEDYNSKLNGAEVEGKEIGSGYWRLTETGFKFLRNEITIPDMYFSINDQVHDISTDFKNWHQMLQSAKAFDLKELVVG